jgi:hypothetical protein
LGHWNLPFDLAQGGESFDFAQDREPVERLVEPFEIWFLVPQTVSRFATKHQPAFSDTLCFGYRTGFFLLKTNNLQKKTLT